MIGLAVQIALPAIAETSVTQVAFRPLEPLSRADLKAQSDLTLAVQRIVSVVPLKSCSLEGTIWSSSRSGSGQGGYQVQWVLKHQVRGIIGSWSAWVDSYRELISSMPGSGLAQPNGLAGEIAEAARRAQEASEAWSRQDLDVRLFRDQDEDYVPPAALQPQESQDLRIVVMPPGDGHVMKLLLLGHEIAASEVIPVRKWRATRFAETWNPAFGQTLAVFFIPQKEGNQPSPPSTLSSEAPAFIQEALPFLGPVLAHRAVSKLSPQVRWRVF